MVEHFGLRSDDVLYCPYPLFHLDASVLTVMPALVLGATAAIGARFSASGFWPEVRAFGATVFDFMGATLTILHKQPERDDDRDNPVRLGWGVPLPDFAPQFEQRFGLRLVEAYGSTDVGVPIYSRPGEPRRPGACGRPIDAYDVRLFDGDDVEVPVGAVGEIVVRPNEPSLICDGYLGMPAETVRATRNLWFHTGDLARRDADGFIYFVGRGTDTIRRRGENISAFEVEEVIEQHPDVVEVAAFGVPSELTEEDVMVTVVARPGRTVDPVDLVSFCVERMARFMVPRYVDVVSALPKTPDREGGEVPAARARCHRDHMGRRGGRLTLTRRRFASQAGAATARIAVTTTSEDLPFLEACESQAPSFAERSPVARIFPEGGDLARGIRALEPRFTHFRDRRRSWTLATRVFRAGHVGATINAHSSGNKSRGGFIGYHRSARRSGEKRHWSARGPVPVDYAHGAGSGRRVLDHRRRELRGGALPLSILFALVGCLFVALSIGQLAKHLPSAAGFATYTSRGLHPSVGFMVAWGYALAEALVAPLLYLIFANVVAGTLAAEYGWSFDTWWPIATVVAAVLVFALGWFGIRLSAGAGTVLGLFEIVVFAALAVWMILEAGGNNTLSVFGLEHATVEGFSGINGVVAGSVFAILAFIGFEAAAPLAEEARNPTRTVRVAVIASAVLIGLFYVLTTYAATVFFGPERFAEFPAFGDGNPWQQLGRDVWGVGWVLVFLAVIISAVANSNASANATTRTWYALGRNRILTGMLARTHPKWQSPHVAVVVQFVLALAVALPLGFYYDPVTAFSLVATMVTAVIILIYITLNLACIGFYLKERRSEFNVVAAPDPARARRARLHSGDPGRAGSRAAAVQLHHAVAGTAEFRRTGGGRVARARPAVPALPDVDRPRRPGPGAEPAVRR